MHDRGYTAVGVADVCAAAGVRKGSFYYFFDSKQTLTRAVIQAHWHRQREHWLAALAGPGPALRRVEELFAMHTDNLRAEHAAGTVTGCLFANLSLELSTQDEQIRADLAAVFDEQAALLAAALTQAQEGGDLGADRPAEELAHALLAQLEGQVLFAKLRNSTTALAGMWPTMRQLIG